VTSEDDVKIYIEELKNNKRDIGVMLANRNWKSFLMCKLMAEFLTTAQRNAYLRANQSFDVTNSCSTLLLEVLN
jgi:hypothetical protein